MNKINNVSLSIFMQQNNISKRKEERVNFKGQLGEELMIKASKDLKTQGLPTVDIIIDKIATLRGLSISRTRDVLETLLSTIKRKTYENNKLLQDARNTIEQKNSEIASKKIEIAELKAKIEELQNKMLQK